MSELQAIQVAVSRAGHRRRWQRAWQGLGRGLLAGALIWLVGLTLYKLLPVPVLTVAVSGALAVAAMAIGFLVGVWRGERALTTANWLDQRQQLKERLSSALEIAQDATAGEWRELVIGDAARHVRGMDVRRVVPYHLTRACHWSLLALLLGAGLGFVPEYRSKAFLQREKDKESVREAGRNLAGLSRRTLERRTPALESTREAIQSVGTLGQKLTQNPATKNEALRDLAKLTDRVGSQARELGRSPALRQIERSARSAGPNAPASSEELQKQIEALQKSLGNREGHDEALDKLQRELEKARRAAAEMAGGNTPASEAARNELAQALASLSQQAQEMGASLPALNEAIAALQAGQIDQMLKDLKVAEKDLEKLREMARALQQMQQQASQLGKDLAEQLKNGQAEAAIRTLEKMADQVRSPNLTEEQLKALMEQVNKALGPSAPYGKVPEFLKDAMKQMQGGQKGAASKALGDAAKELADLLAQLADAQDLKSTLDALKRAQVCVGNGSPWGQCQGQMLGMGGNKPGRGVGTWAEEEGWIDPPENTGLWDNSGIERPDMASRGVADRGEGEVPEGMLPAQVKGQFQPGMQMPSITLKGVSIKGQSAVAIGQAIQAAQSEAQSALSHDQVPRAYQGAVKGYFDDLKR